MNLTALQHSAFLQSLGWAIANSLWQSAILWVTYHLINASYKNATSKFKNLLSTTLLFAIFAWFTQTFLHKLFLLQDQINAKAIIDETVFNYTAPANPAWKILLNNVLNELPYLSVAYLLLLVIFSVRLINSYRSIHFIKNNGLQKPPVEWRLFTDKVAMHIGIHKKIKLWFSEHIDVPATLGFIKPVILIPLATVNQLSADQLEAIILHELSHIKRNDYFINLFISIIETILFFNPFVVLLSKIIKRERENCCDDFVIQYKYDPHAYASALLSLEQSRIMNLRLALTATSGKKQLLVRIKRIMESKGSSTNFNYGQKLLSLLLVTGIVTSIAWLSPQKKESNTETKKTSREKITTTKSIWKVKTSDGTNQQTSISVVTKNKKNFDLLKILKPIAIQGNTIDCPKQKNAALPFDVNQNFLTADDDENTFVRTPELAPALTNAPPAVFYRNQSPLFYSQKGELLKELSKKLDIKKMQADLEKTNFSFSMDWNKWHDEIMSNIQDIQFDDMSSMQGFKKLSSEEMEKLVQAELKKLKARAPLRIPQPRMADVTRGVNIVTSRLNKKLYVLIDSIASLSTAVLDKSDQKSFRKLPAPIVNKFLNPGALKAYQEAGKAYAFQYQIDATKNQKILLRRNSAKQVYNYECTDGVILLNGKKIISVPEGSAKSNTISQGKNSIKVNSEGNIIRIEIGDN